jgi:hypothetical protein
MSQIVRDDLIGKSSHEFRGKLRAQYRDLINQTKQTKSDLVNPSNDGLNKGLKIAHGLFEDVDTTREASIDSKYIAISAGIYIYIYSIKRLHKLSN